MELGMGETAANGKNTWIHSVDVSRSKELMERMDAFSEEELLISVDYKKDCKGLERRREAAVGESVERLSSSRVRQKPYSCSPLYKIGNWLV